MLSEPVLALNWSIEELAGDEQAAREFAKGRDFGDFGQFTEIGNFGDFGHFAEIGNFGNFGDFGWPGTRVGVPANGKVAGTRVTDQSSVADNCSSIMSLRMTGRLNVNTKSHMMKYC